ncbi:uncharacterized protein V6R79_021105 [Siganus canaliculatus]
MEAFDDIAMACEMLLQDTDNDDDNDQNDNQNQVEGAAHASQPRVIRRDEFNNTEIHQFLNLPPPQAIPDYAEFYGNVMAAVQHLTDRVLSHSERHVVIQLELRRQNLQNNVAVVIDNDAGADLTAFQALLDQVVQSNMAVMTDPLLELIVQIIHNPGGGGKRELETVIDEEIIKKKRRYLYCVENNNQLCFSICVAHLLNPLLTDEEAESCGREIQENVGLSCQTPVTFTDIAHFERVLKRETLPPRRPMKSGSNFAPSNSARYAFIGRHVILDDTPPALIGPDIILRTCTSVIFDLLECP